MLLIEYRNVKDTEMKRWITSTLRNVFVLCFGEKHRDMGNKEGESPQLKEVRGHIVAGGFYLLSSFWDKVSLDISATGMHMGASGLFFYICLPEPMWRWKFWGWDCRCESLYTAFLLGPGDQTQVSRRSVLLFTAPHGLILIFYKIFLVTLYTCACDFSWWKYSKLRCYINHVIQWNNFLCSKLMRIIYKLHKEFELKQFVLEDHFTINRITF